MLSEMPLFWFEYHMMYWQNKSYLCEVCVWWNGTVEIMEMVELEAKNGYE
jgi:hypothetical protein